MPAGLLDTSVVIDWDEPMVIAALPEESSVSAITLAELAAGPHLASTAAEGARRQARYNKSRPPSSPLPSTPPHPAATDSLCDRATPLPAGDADYADPPLLRRANVGCQTSADWQKPGLRCTIEEGAFALTHQLLTIALPVETLAAKHPPEHLTGTQWIPIGHPPEGKR
jgi:hypothetical protein